MVDSSDVSHLAFAKKLADNDLPARTATLKGLANFFSKSGPLKEVDLIKIWMGLWYAMWMSDKPLVQRELAESISKLVHTHSSIDNAILFIKVFYSTMHREFPKIDRLRHDKFLKFARIFVHNSLKFIKNKDYDADLINKYHAAVTAEWQKDDAQEIQLHMCDVFVEELYLACGSVVPSEAFYQFAAVFADQLEHASHSILKERLFEALRSFIYGAAYCTPKHRPKNKKSLDHDKDLFPDVEFVNVDLGELEQWFLKRASTSNPIQNRKTLYDLRDIALKKKRAPAGFQLLNRGSIQRKVEEAEAEEYKRLMEEYEEQKANEEKEEKPKSKKERLIEKKQQLRNLKKAAREKKEKQEEEMEEEKEEQEEDEAMEEITAAEEPKGKKKKDNKRKAESVPATATITTTKVVKKNAKGEVVGKQVETTETVVRDNGKEKVTEVTTTTKETAVKKTPIKKGQEQKGESEQQTNGRKRKDVEPEVSVVAPSPANGKTNEKRTKLNPVEAEVTPNGKAQKGKKGKQIEAAEEPTAATEEVAVTPKGKKGKKGEAPATPVETTPKGKGKQGEEREEEDGGVTPKGKGKKGKKGKEVEMSTPPAAKASEVPPSTGKKAVRFSSENLIKEFDKSTAVNTSPSPSTPKATPVKLKSLLTPPSKKK